MDEKKQCPACGRLVGKELGKCPHCGMDGLNRIFNSEADYREWVRLELDPYKAQLLPRIFAGANGVLILQNNGKLYGMGNNDSGSFGNERLNEIVKTPQLVAENIKRAAAGYCYNLCLTEDGRLMLIGKTGIPYKSRLKQIPGAEDVFAAPDRDVFWILLKDGSVYVWGDNQKGFITPATSEVIHQFDQIELKVEYRNSLTKRYVSRTNGPRYDINNWGSGSDKAQLLGNVEIQLKQTEIYRNYAKRYGEDNLRAEFILLEKKLHAEGGQNEKEYESYVGYDSITKSTWKIYKETYQPKLILSNRYIYQPMKAADAQKYRPGFCYYGSGLAACGQIADAGQAEKIAKFKIKEVWHQAVLKRDNSLEVYDDKKLLRTVPDVADVAVAAKAYVLTRDGTLWKGDAEDLAGRSGLAAFTAISGKA